MKILPKLLMCVLCFIGSVAYAQSSTSIESLGELARCNAMATIYIQNGGKMTEGNRRFFSSGPSDFDSTMRAIFTQVNECRASNPNDGALHQRCSESLPKNRKVMYESYLKGNSMMTQAYANQDKAKIGTYMLACSK